MPINLVLHDVVAQEGEVDTPYTLTLSRLQEIISLCDQFPHIKFRLYFDDGYKSFYDQVLPYASKREHLSFCVSVVTDWIDTEGYLSTKQLQDLQTRSVRLVSHSCSHAALVIYDEADTSILQPFKKGSYKNTPHGKKDRLSEQEILYQLYESKSKLEEAGIHTDEFVFPYGLYSQEVVLLNTYYNIYRILSTCETGLDTGQSLRPRILLDNKFKIDNLREQIWKLSNQKKP